MLTTHPGQSPLGLGEDSPDGILQRSLAPQNGARVPNAVVPCKPAKVLDGHAFRATHEDPKVRAYVVAVLPLWQADRLESTGAGKRWGLQGCAD